MTDVTTPQPQSGEPTGEKPVEAQGKVNPEDEVFDKARAMETIEKLREIEKQSKKEKRELEELRKAEQTRKDAELSESERLKKQLADAMTQLRESNLKQLRAEIAAEVGLPGALAQRLQGTNEEEIRADATRLLEVLPKVSTETIKDKPKPPTLKPTNPGENASQHQTREQQRADIFGVRSAGVFDQDVAAAKAGGVHFPEEK